ncbi:AcrR family transcriptional regulator [Cryobacterium sp. CAN_C3]|uniref:TetR/AcrR family transcriptional regulator n=1 Tax=unclassified Cryobacterium TaxID=2649013 RepID=UPI0018C9AD7D|nr:MULTISPECIES: TetR/AcrR family transcriptional regulator [unclassified Cryobacterium]MEC5152726.1 AcrR family transcriptional regulator [Cryobacterium sp. CAN_C3]
MPATLPARPASTRDRLLDAFEELLIEGGERSATLDAVAAAASVSKGGLLYHFGSKDALVDGQLERLDAFAATDAENIRSAPAGPVDYLIRTSVHGGSPLDRAYVASSRLAQGRHPRAIQILGDIRRRWLSVIEDTVHDRDVAQTIMLISDGLYVNSSLAGPESLTPEAADMDRLIAVISRLLP